MQRLGRLVIRRGLLQLRLRGLVRRNDFPRLIHLAAEVKLIVRRGEFARHVKPQLGVDRPVGVGFFVGGVFAALVIIEFVARIPRRESQLIVCDRIGADLPAVNQQRVLAVQIRNLQPFGESVDHLSVAVDLELLIAAALPELQSDFIVFSGFELAGHFLIGRFVDDFDLVEEVVQVGIRHTARRTHLNCRRAGNRGRAGNRARANQHEGHQQTDDSLHILHASSSPCSFSTVLTVTRQ